MVILIFILLLSMCFCPGLVLGLMKCIISNILQFVTWIASLTYEGLQFIFSAAVIAYRALRQNQNTDRLDNQATRPIQSELPTIQNEVQFCDPSVPNDCPPTPIASAVAPNSRPILKSLKYINPSAHMENEGAPFIQPTAPLYPPVPRTPTFQRIFREWKHSVIYFVDMFLLK